MNKFTQERTQSDPDQAQTLITKTRLYNFDPLKPHFYITGVLQGYTLFFLFLLKT